MTTTGWPEMPTLDRAAGHVHQAMRGAMLIKLDTSATDAESLSRIQASADAVLDSTRSALGILQHSGARVASLPGERRPIPLDKLDTPATRNLLDALETALMMAEVVDEERGRSMAEDAVAPGECRGVDLAEAVQELALRVRLEIFGPNIRE